MNTIKTISEKDSRIITDVVNTFWNDGLSVIKIQILRIFTTDITTDHFILLGQVIGIRSATEFKKLNNNLKTKTQYYESNN